LQAGIPLCPTLTQKLGSQEACTNTNFAQPASSHCRPGQVRSEGKAGYMVFPVHHTWDRAEQSLKPFVALSGVTTVPSE